MSEPLRNLAGWPEVLAAPDHLKTEVLSGELMMSPRPAPSHGLAQAALSGLLMPPYYFGRGGPGGWWLVIEPDLELTPHDIVSPDLVGFRRERLPRFPSERPIRVVPDWVCEVLSPSTMRWDRIGKADLYLRSGVGYLWFVDGDERILEAFAACQGAWTRLGAWTDGDRPRVEPFAEIELELESLLPPSEPSEEWEAPH